MTRLWAKTGTEFSEGWRQIRARAIETMQVGRAAAIHAALPYMSEVLAETRQAGIPSGVLVPAAFLEAAPNGFLVQDTLDRLPVVAKQAVAGGATALEARSQAAVWLSGVTLTMLADTRRDVFHADMVQRPQLTGYVRMLNPPSCDRCVILAGKRFLWNEGFQRHPNCDCIHIPASEQVAGDLTTDPYAYFNSLDEAGQNKLFGKHGAQAIRDGADIYRVGNIRTRGLGTAAGNRRYGTPYRRTVEDIYSHDRDRKFVVENLRYHGYITGPQIAGGNILGNDPAGRILAAGRGRGTYTVGGQTVTTARAAKFDALASGRRDPLNRATMTAAERRLYDAHYRAQWAAAGYRPNSVGANSADRGLGLRPITQREAQRAQDTLRAELAIARDHQATPNQVRELAALLGL
ncbi:hypothetical protein [Leucobacter sp. M11]|uniref:hypothetical protein n=1 Tax=Leucobacter sp. M11 TaxID=2993565 RepID=UPI002D7EE952|nr:hypothetical protein [Leucobacter sp. M11]MEB4613992.1 hypothetical protein [Leucobacter sp. M11]